MQGDVATGLMLATAAGLCTAIGSVLGLFIKNPGKGVMAFALGFSAGAMILVSFVELLPGGIDAIGFGKAHLAFFIGFTVMFLVDVLIPHDYMAEKYEPRKGHDARILRTGLLIALGLGIHNFPEGIATFAGSLESTGVGASIAVAVAIHNIPEGLAVSVPVLAATGSRARAFWWSFLSGVMEPVGAACAALFLMGHLNHEVVGWFLAAVAGVMVFISIDELVPTACSYGRHHTAIAAVGVGMAMMAFSLWLL